MLISFLPACTTSAEKEESHLTNEEQKKLDEYKAEVELGRNMAGRLLQFYGTYGDTQLVGYVNQIGSYVASYGDYPERRYMFSILDTESVNAFACPGGYILVTLGSIRLARSEAELAMILGHEIAHVGKKHMFNTLMNMGKQEREKAVDDVEEKSVKDTPYETVVRKRPSADDSKAGALIARYLSSGSGGPGFGLLQAAKAGMNVILEKGLDKKLEYEADREGVKYAIRAGYAPKAFFYFLTRLQKQKRKDAKEIDTQILEKTHPKVSTRKARIKALLREMQADEIIGAYGERRFKDYLKKLPEPSKS